MAHVYLDQHETDKFRVAWTTGTGTKEQFFDTRQAAEVFADKKMGARGSILSTLDMTSEKLAALKAKQARLKASLDALGF